MNEDVQDPRHWYWERHRREAEAPLTPAQLEQKRNNRKLAQFDASIQKLAMDLGRAKGRWLESRLLGLCYANDRTGFLRRGGRNGIRIDAGRLE